jgi:rsbT co-antagonist protein RsbR
VIGIVDSARASDMMARVLEAVERKQCRFLIIDITGVDVIDTATADRFLKLVTAAEILGTQCFLTGARAGVAQTLASLGMDLKGLTTLRNLKHGIAECMRAMELMSRQSPLKDLSLAGHGRG